MKDLVNRSHTYRQINEVLQIRNPLRSPTDCCFPVGIPYSLQEAIFPYCKGIPLRVAALIKSNFFYAYTKILVPPRISVFLRTPPPEV